MVWSRMKPQFTKLSSLACGDSANLAYIEDNQNVMQLKSYSICIQNMFKSIILYFVYFLYIILWIYCFGDSTKVNIFNFEISKSDLTTFWLDDMILNYVLQYAYLYCMLFLSKYTKYKTFLLKASSQTFQDVEVHNIGEAHCWTSFTGYQVQF